MKRSLTATTVDKAKPKAAAYKLTDGGGLYLFVSPAGAKSWRYKYRLLGKEKTYTIGGYPEVSLADARKAHDAARVLVAGGRDPGQHRKAESQKAANAERNTFKAVALLYIAKQTDPENPKWTESYAEKVRRIFARDVFPDVGEMKVGDVGAAEISAIMERVAKRKKVKMPHQKKVRVRERGAALTALHIKSLCKMVFAYAATKGLVNKSFDPLWALGNDVVSRPEVKHAGYLELHELPAFWNKLGSDTASERVKLGVELLALTFVRTGELRLAEKGEFHELDGANPYWLIPASKMKKRRDHLVPLAPRAVEIVKGLFKLADEEQSQYLFPSRTRDDGVMNPNTINQTLYRMGYAGKLSGHGFRATASTALNGRGYAPHLVEMQLAHWGGKDKTAASYNHALYAVERAEMMREWAVMLHADHCNVVPFKKTA